MPKLALLLEALLSRFFTFLAVKYGVEIATKLTVIGSLAALYVGGLVTFNSVVGPFISALFSTSFGMVIGLAFPPIAGTVMTGLFTLWAGTMTYRYFHQFGMALIAK